MNSDNEINSFDVISLDSSTTADEASSSFTDTEPTANVTSPRQAIEETSDYDDEDEDEEATFQENLRRTIELSKTDFQTARADSLDRREARRLKRAKKENFRSLWAHYAVIKPYAKKNKDATMANTPTDDGSDKDKKPAAKPTMANIPASEISDENKKPAAKPRPPNSDIQADKQNPDACDNPIGVTTDIISVAKHIQTRATMPTHPSTCNDNDTASTVSHNPSKNSVIEPESEPAQLEQMSDSSSHPKMNRTQKRLFHARQTQEFYKEHGIVTTTQRWEALMKKVEENRKKKEEESRGKNEKKRKGKK